jgi:hypothetical protein
MQSSRTSSISRADSIRQRRACRTSGRLLSGSKRARRRAYISAKPQITALRSPVAERRFRERLLTGLLVADRPSSVSLATIVSPWRQGWRYSQPLSDIGHVCFLPANSAQWSEAAHRSQTKKSGCSYERSSCMRLGAAFLRASSAWLRAHERNFCTRGSSSRVS